MSLDPSGIAERFYLGGILAMFGFPFFTKRFSKSPEQAGDPTRHPRVLDTRSAPARRSMRGAEPAVAPWSRSPTPQPQRAPWRGVPGSAGAGGRQGGCSGGFGVPCACVQALLQSPPQYGEGNGTPLQYSCLENPMDRGAWWAAVHGVTNSRTRLCDFTVTFHFHALEKEMATHSSVLAWRIPGTGEPGGLPSMGSHRVGHD